MPVEFEDEIQTQSPMPMSRRKLLQRASVMSLAVGGMGLAISGCDRLGGKDDKSSKPADADHGGMSHGSGGMDEAIQTVTPQIIQAAASARLTRFDPALPPLPEGGTLRLKWTAQDIPLQVSPNTTLVAWTFENNCPGPIAHCRVGDTVEFTLTNQSAMPHAMDFHAAQIDPRTAFANVAEGQSISFTFKPRYAGAYLYHCGTQPMLLHIGAGMYGAIIVSPQEPLPPAREFVLVQGEYYLGPPVSDIYSLDYARMLTGVPSLVAFNGRPDQYMRDPIRVKVGERVRFWVVNAGPNVPCAFHVVGEQFDTVYIGQPPDSAIHGVQTFSVPPGGGMGFELLCDVPGEFPFMNHACAYGQIGAMGTLIVEK